MVGIPKQVMRTIHASLLFLLCGLFLLPRLSYGASIYTHPASENRVIGESFALSVYASSTENAINAASGTITFAPDMLEIVSVSKASSVITLWAQEPIYSNGNGTLSFEGVLLGSDYQGSSGKLLQVTFRAKQAGSTTISTSSGLLLANDGLGTNIPVGYGSTTLNISPATTPTVVPSTQYPPEKPQGTSITHPNTDAWYMSPIATFSWSVPTGVSLVRFDVTQNPEDEPRTLATAQTTEYTTSSLAEGIWYFHLQFKNTQGWSEVQHIPLHIDATAPEAFPVSRTELPNSSYEKVTLTFSTTDTLSGLDYYEVIVDGQSPTLVRPEELIEGTYSLNISGTATITVRAFDAAGNSSSSEIKISQSNPNVPHLTVYPSVLEKDEFLVVQGDALPNTSIVVSLINEQGYREIQQTKSTSSGSFIVIWPKKLNSGTYQIFAEIVDNQGNIQRTPEDATFSVLSRFGKIAPWIIPGILAAVFFVIALRIAYIMGRRSAIPFSK